MLYECDERNCNVGKDLCTNRAFADLQERKAAGGKYRTGVEVIKTADRGYGVRANRCFEPNQIIMEYTGEIITEEECENRMNTKYKNNAVSPGFPDRPSGNTYNLSCHVRSCRPNELTCAFQCYYLMSFDQNMIIDATNGSIARFVNHSCKPNCKMVKWIVGCQPRMALFAGDQPIMTGDELTYDYNFDPFSAKNVQTCLCGEENCRGVLGPKPKEKESRAKAAKDAGNGKGKVTAKSSGQTNGKTKTQQTATAKTVKEVVKGAVKAGKRKLGELVGDKNDGDGSAPKKRKTSATTNTQKKAATAAAKATTSAVRSLMTPKRTTRTVLRRKYSSVSARMSKLSVKGTGTMKKSVSTATVNSKNTAPTNKMTTESSQITTIRTSSSGRVLRASNRKRESIQQATVTSPPASDLTIVAAGSNGKTRTANSLSRTAPSGTLNKSPRKALELSRSHSRVRMVSPEEQPTITARVA